MVDAKDNVDGGWQAAKLRPNAKSRTTMALLYGFGDLLYAFLLVINALAVLSEERFLARGTSTWPLMAAHRCRVIVFELTRYMTLSIVGWSSSQATQQAYSGYEQTPEESIKQRLVHLIAAVRTLLRSESIALVLQRF